MKKHYKYMKAFASLAGIAVHVTHIYFLAYYWAVYIVQKIHPKV